LHPEAPEESSKREYGITAMQPLIILFLFFITGAVGLAFQVLWIDMLVNVFGTTVYAVSTVISSFFAGLALGSYLFGKIGEKTRNPLRLYGALELCVGLYALITLALFTRINDIWAFMYVVAGSNSLLYSVARFSLCFLVLLVPTTLMGGTLPVLSKYFVRNLRSLGWNIGLIYSVNTFGALVGCFLAGFVLISAFGIRTTLYAGVTCNVLVAACAFLISIREKEHTVEETKTAHTKSVEFKSGEPMLSPAATKLVLAAFAVSGLASLSYELLWARILVYFIGVQTYAYTIMLMAFLFGIAFGSIVFARLIDSVEDNMFLFGVVEILIGVFSIIGLSAMGHLGNIIDFFKFSGFITTWWHYASTKFLASVIFMLVPTFLIGSTFPVVSKIFITNVNRVSKNVGDIYALNTIGGIFGSLLTGFILLPVLGVRRSILLVVSINIMLGLLLILASRKRKRLFGRAAAVLGVSAFVPVLHFATVDRPILQDWNVNQKKSTYDILYCKEGIECTLSVLHNKRSGHLELNINGQSTAYTTYLDIQVHKMLIHIPMLIHPDPNEVLVVGFGMGCTGYGATLHERANVTCVELVKDEIEAAKYFKNLNKDVLENPRFNFVHDDGRNYIQLVDRNYDVISFNAIHPRLSPALYTTDFYEMCRRRMKPDSLICAWLPTTWITEPEFRSLVNTFISVFPETTFWLCHTDHVILLGSMTKTEIDFDAFKQKIAQPEISEHLRTSNLANPFSFIGTLVLGPKGLEAYVGDASVITDDHSKIKFSRCLDYGLNEAVWGPIFLAREQYFPELIGMIKTSSDDDRRAVYDNLKSLEPFVMGQILSDPKFNKHKEALVEYDKALELAPQNRNVAYLKLESQIISGIQE
jgi:spermidine synthase